MCKHDLEGTAVYDGQYCVQSKREESVNAAGAKVWLEAGPRLMVPINCSFRVFLVIELGKRMKGDVEDDYVE